MLWSSHHIPNPYSNLSILKSCSIQYVLDIEANIKWFNTFIPNTSYCCRQGMDSNPNHCNGVITLSVNVLILPTTIT